MMRVGFAVWVLAGCVRPPDSARPAPAEPASPKGDAPTVVATVAPSSVALDPIGGKPVVEIASSAADLDDGVFASSFEIDDLDDLLVRVRFPGGAPPAGLRLEVYTPGGGLYAVYREPFDGDADEVLFALPVAGTEIGRRPIAGEFGLAAAADGAGDPVAAATVDLLAPPDEEDAP